MLVEQGEKVVLYAWHREVYGVLLERLKDLNPVLYTGSENTPAKKEASRNAFVSGESKVIIISLRSGAGLDGLQFACRTVVFGELDWSPGVMEQNIGRVDRDGQPDPVFAYFLVADSGSDPVISGVLGLKREQVELVVDPSRPLVEKLQVDPGHVKKLAEAYLEKRRPVVDEEQRRPTVRLVGGRESGR
jgi:SNF2 family DNA or RNA helicase